MTEGRAKLVDPAALPPYGMGSGHPFADDRLAPFSLLLRELRWLPPSEVLPSTPATNTELGLGHSAEYIAVQEALSDPERQELALHGAGLFGMGSSDNPVVVGQHAAAAAAVGATLACVRAVLDGRAEHAFNPGGGLHHAMPSLASGFCIYNDLVIAIREARRRGLARVLYVDFDVHHGDGVEHAFVGDPNVLTISFHETPQVRWPGTGWVHEIGRDGGKGFAINVPFASGTGDASWLATVTEVLTREARRFRPELIVSQHGCDTHREDPLADLVLTTRPMQAAAELTHSLAHELCEGRWVATGGGGYRPRHVLPRAWAAVWAVMSGRTVPETLPEAWRSQVAVPPDDPLPTRFHDLAEPNPREGLAGRINAATLERLVEILARVRS